MKESFSKFLANNCSEEELNSVIESFTSPSNHLQLGLLMKSAWKEMGDEGETHDLDDVLHRIHYLVNTLEKPVSRMKRIINSSVRITAVILLFLTCILFYQVMKGHPSESNIHTLTTPLASRTSFTLPDGSLIWLNAGSSVTYPGRFSGKKREVSISGEAYFNVQKGKMPFFVQTEGFSIEVPGTAFNLSAYPGEPGFVTLERGKVRIIKDGIAGKYLLPGQQAFIDPATPDVSIRPVETSIYTSWKENQLIFNDEPLEEVVKRLERWYNIEIVIKDETLKKTRINGKIDMESFTEVLELLELTVPLKYHYKMDSRVVTLEESK